MRLSRYATAVSVICWPTGAPCAARFDDTGQFGAQNRFLGRNGPAQSRAKSRLPDLEPLIFPIWMVSHRELHTSRRIRMVFDLLAAELART